MLQICCALQQTVALQIIRNFSNYLQRNLALCDSHCNLRLEEAEYMNHMFARFGSARVPGNLQGTTNIVNFIEMIILQPPLHHNYKFSF